MIFTRRTADLGKIEASSMAFLGAL